MDTKLKNGHKIGVLLILLTIFLSAGCMTALYPYMEQCVNEKLQAVYRNGSKQMEQDSDFAVDVVKSNYALWQEYKQAETRKMMTAEQVFLTPPQEADQEAVQTAAQLIRNEEVAAVWDEINIRASVWRNRFQSIRPYMKYTVKDASGNILLENTGSSFDSTQTDVKISVSYDNIGRMSVEEAATGLSEYGKMAERQLTQSLGSYYMHNPVEEISQNYGSFYDDHGNLVKQSVPEFFGPRDIMYQYEVNQDMIFPSEEGNLWEQAYQWYDTRGVLMVSLVIMAVIIVIALLLPAFPWLAVGNEKIFRVPCELVLAIGGLGTVLLVSPVPVVVVASTVKGFLWEEIIKAGLLPGAAAFLAWLLNFLAWSLGFALVYWGITCLRSVFSIGLYRYLKERTIIGRFIAWIWRKWNQLVKKWTKINWDAPALKQLSKVLFLNFIILVVISCLWFFGIVVLMIYSLGLFIWLRKYYDDTTDKYYKLLGMIDSMAEGNLEASVEEDLGVFEPIKEKLMVVRQGFKAAVKKEVESQRMKTELITNVSHDLKTPLTAIITYVNLLKDENISEEERNQYIEILEKKSWRLKVLIEDLFDVSKATSGNMPCNKIDVDLVSMLKEIRVELEDRIQASDVDFRWKLPEDRVVVSLDSQRTYRIFSNLIVNITKYAMPETRVYIELEADDGKTVVTLKTSQQQKSR